MPRRALRGWNLHRLSPKVLEEFQILAPVDVEEQRRIAAILDKADTIRRKRRQALDEIDALLRATFLEMFGDPWTNPKGWPIERLGKYISFTTSGSRGWARFYSDVGHRFIRSLDVKMNWIAWADTAFVKPPELAEADRTRVRYGDVLLTITGSRIGRTATVEDDIQNAHISRHVAIIRLKLCYRANIRFLFSQLTFRRPATNREISVWPDKAGS